MTTTAHHGHHQRHATIAYEWLLKSVEIILFSRRGGDLNDETTSIAEKNREKKKKKTKKKTKKKNSWWFNLHPNFLDNDLLTDDDEEIDEDEDGDGIGDASILLRKQLEPWRVNDNELGFNPTPLVLDIFHHHHRDDDDDERLARRRDRAGDVDVHAARRRVA